MATCRKLRCSAALRFRQIHICLVLTGLALSIAGVVVLNGGAFSASGDSHIRGDAVAVGAAMFYAGYFVMLSRARSQFSTPVVMLWSTVAAAVFTLPIALLHDSAIFPSTIAAWTVLLALGWEQADAVEALLRHEGNLRGVIDELAHDRR